MNTITIINNTIWMYFKYQCNLYNYPLTVVVVSLDGPYRFQIWYLL